MSLIGNITIGLQAQTSGLTQGINKAQALIGSFGVGIAVPLNMATAAIGAVGKIASMTFDAVGESIGKLDAVGDMADKLSMSASGLMGLQAAAKEVDVDSEALNGSLMKMQVNLGKAATGSKTASGAFEQLGLDVGQLQAMDPAEQFKAIAGQLATIQDPAQQAALSMEIFGKQGTSLLPILRQGADGINALEAAAASRGQIFTDEEIALVGAADKAMEHLWSSLGSIADRIAVEVAPYITMMLDGLEAAGFTGANFGKIISTAFDLIKSAIKSLEPFFAYAYGHFLKLQAIVVFVGQVIYEVFTKVWNSVGGVTGGFFKFIFDGLKWVMSAVMSLMQGLLNAAGWILKKLGVDVEAAIEQLNNSFSAANAAQEAPLFSNLASGADVATDAAKNVTSAFVEVNEEVQKLNESITDLTADWQLQSDTFGMSSRQAKIFELAQQGANEEQLASLRILDEKLTKQEEDKKKQEEALKKQEEAQKAIEAADKALTDQGKSITDSVMTPLEKYNKKMQELEMLLEKGKISKETFDRASTAAGKDLSGDKTDSEVKLAGVAKAGSSDAYSILSSARNQENSTQNRIFKQGETQTGLLQQLVANTRGLNGQENAYEFN